MVIVVESECVPPSGSVTVSVAVYVPTWPGTEEMSFVVNWSSVPPTPRLGPVTFQRYWSDDESHVLGSVADPVSWTSSFSLADLSGPALAVGAAFWTVTVLRTTASSRPSLTVILKGQACAAAPKGESSGRLCVIWNVS